MLRVGPKPAAMTSQKVRVFGSSAPVCDAIRSGLSIICQKYSAYMDLTRWYAHVYQLLQRGADISVLLGLLVTLNGNTLRIFPLHAS